MIGQSELPPLPLAYRGSELSCTLSPILSQSERLSDNSDLDSSITQISKDFGESDHESLGMDYPFESVYNNNSIQFVKPLTNGLIFENQLYHFDVQINHRPAGAKFVWRLNGRKLQKPSTLGLRANLIYPLYDVIVYIRLFEKSLV